MRIIYTARVTNTQDPEGLGRIQVTLDGFEEAIELPWIRMVGPYASDGFGAVFLPEEDDEVIVLLGDADGIDQMVCLGSVYNGDRKPPYRNDDGQNDIKILQTRAGHTVRFSDEDDKEVVQIHTLDEKLLIELDHANGRIILRASDEVEIDVEGGDVTVSCENATVKAARKISMIGEQDIAVHANGTLEISGDANVKIISASHVEVHAQQVSLQGDRVELN